ncbi:MAG: 50S ribosomal protein L21 [Alphaproteobacteria bacterium]|nr:MAG: 50S ribosomal protein L21 [Alphaproteobacteria bacterium]
MFAVVKTGGKQYKVVENDVLTVERLPGAAGETVTLDEVLLVGDEKGVKVGTPTVAGTVVTAEIVEQTRGDKIIVFKKKRRHNYRRKRGHRQDLTVLKVLAIGAAKAKPAAKKAAPKATAPEKVPEKAKETPKKTPAKKPAAKQAETASKTKAAPKTTKAKAAPKKAAAKATTPAKKAPAKKAAPKAAKAKSAPKSKA